VSTIHEKTVELIPWYVNGTLQPDEHRAVEQHLSECLPCRAALKQEHRLGGLVREQVEVPPGAGHGISELLRTIDAGKTRGNRGLRPAPILWSAGVAAALLVAILLIPAILFDGNGIDGDGIDQGAFRTLSDTQPAGEPRLDIVFADGLTEAERNEIVANVGGRVIAGPTELGRYTIEIATPARADVDAVIDELSEDARIRFVGRNFIGTSPSAPEEP